MSGVEIGRSHAASYQNRVANYEGDLKRHEWDERESDSEFSLVQLASLGTEGRREEGGKGSEEVKVREGGNHRPTSIP